MGLQYSPCTDNFQYTTVVPTHHCKICKCWFHWAPHPSFLSIRYEHAREKLNIIRVRTVSNLAMLTVGDALSVLNVAHFIACHIWQPFQCLRGSWKWCYW